jgi:crotonobetainyl-CoA:carnitine CoA-transferase CaiB-like acyl-CoA transferase
MGAVFLNINRNKKSICIDLKSPDGQLIVKKLIKLNSNEHFKNFNHS